jgi:Uma2 family endonuclease
MAMPNLKRRWTVADRDELPDDGNRYEVIDGELFATPAPSLMHQRAVSQLYRLLAVYLDREPVGEAIVSPADIVFSPGRAVQPDLFVLPFVSGRRARNFTDVGRLLLAVEVLSPSTAHTDRVDKRALYRKERVDEYWIVDLDSRILERSTPGESRPEILDSKLEWLPDGAATSFAMDVAEYFEKVIDGAP